MTAAVLQIPVSAQAGAAPVVVGGRHVGASQGRQPVHQALARRRRGHVATVDQQVSPWSAERLRRRSHGRSTSALSASRPARPVRRSPAAPWPIRWWMAGHRRCAAGQALARPARCAVTCVGADHAAASRARPARRWAAGSRRSSTLSSGTRASMKTQLGAGSPQRPRRHPPAGRPPVSSADANPAEAGTGGTWRLAQAAAAAAGSASISARGGMASVHVGASAAGPIF